MAKRENRCFKCAHFQVYSAAPEDAKPEDLFGLCRRHAPEVAIINDRQDGACATGSACWPEVNGIDWCGEFA